MLDVLPPGVTRPDQLREFYKGVKARLEAKAITPNRVRILARRLPPRVHWAERRDWWDLIYPTAIGPTLPEISIGKGVTVPWPDVVISKDAVLMHVQVKPGPLQMIRNIEREICERDGVTVAELHGACRIDRIVRARQEAIYRAWKATGWSFPRIGRHFGDRDHSTIIHSTRKVQARIDAGEMPAPPECLASAA